MASKADAVLSQNEVNTLYEMFSHLVKILNKYAIRYVCTDGTLLGVIRNGGFIPWDDDIDIAIERHHLPTLLWLKSIFEGIEYELVKTGKYYKLKKDNLHIDIFIVDEGVWPQQHFKNLSFIGDEYKPFRTAKFGEIEVSIPNKSEEYLDRILPEWNTTAIIYNHQSNDKQKISLTAELRQPYLPV
tara:strand:- start:89 stop:646 length:558 start_codon:yes stop_codon:yes gene_type:complete